MANSFDNRPKYYPQDRLANFAEWNPNPIIELNLAGDIIYLNLVAHSQFPDILSMGIQHPLLDGIMTQMNSLIKESRELIVFDREVTFSNHIYEQQIFAIPEKETIFIYITDITVRKQMEEEIIKSDKELELEVTTRKEAEIQLCNSSEKLKASLDEKEAMLKEIYHRVKNNLQVISSLLKLQLKRVEEPSVQKILSESIMRVQSMALVHEMLYQSENIAKISMKNYVNNLVKYLYEIYSINPNRIKFIEDIDDISLKIDRAIPCGLIINELISNSLKHAFPDNQSGEIKFSLKKQGDKAVLVIKDNGIGIPPHIIIENTTSLGMRLVHNLTKQIDGKIALNRDKGTQFTLIFLHDQ